MADEVRLIDAELLRTNIAQIAKNCARSDAQKALIGRILFMIENMPTIEAEPDNGWISVKDKLPDDDVSILICSTRKTISKATYSSDMGRYYIVDSDLWYNELDITHWQHLPEPPKENISREESDEQLYGGYEEDRKTMIGSNE